MSVKAGAAPIEPITLEKDGEFTMNVDKGVQTNDGANALVLGNIAAASTDCTDRKFETKRLTRGSFLKVTTAKDRTVWLLFDLDSGFAAGSAVFLISATVLGMPQSSRERFLLFPVPWVTLGRDHDWDSQCQ